MVTPSAPAAPPFAFTCFQACHTSSFGMANGFPSSPDMLTRLLPGQPPRLLAQTGPDEPAPSLRPHYTGLSATTGRSAGAHRDGTQHLAASGGLVRSLSRPSSLRAQYRRAPSRVSARKPQTGLAPPARRTPPGQQYGHSARLIPERALSPRF